MRVRFAQFDLDFDTRQLLRSGEEVHLSPKAFAVLSVLLARRPNVVAKADLFGEIWPDVFVVDGNLNVLVGEILAVLIGGGERPIFPASHQAPRRASSIWRWSPQCLRSGE